MKKLLLIICILFLTGCTDYVEINDLAIITGIIIDYKDDKYNLITELIMNEEENDVKVYETEAVTIETALAKISKMTNKELFIADLKTLIITDNIVENNINYYDYFLRSAKTKMDFHLYYTASENIDKILNIYNEKDGTSLHLDKMISFNDRIFSTSTPLEFIELVGTKLEYGKNPVYPSLTIKENNDEEVLYLNDLVSYNTDLKKLNLTEKESIFYNIVKNNADDTILNIKCDDDYFALELETTESKFDFNNDKFTINVDISSKMYTYHCKYKLTEDTLKKLNKISSEFVKKEITSLLKTAQENNNDFLGIGNYIYKRNTNYFDFKDKSWDENLKNINFEVKSNVKIVSKGEVYESIGDKYGKNK